jgi:radical SAM superfamily enzyme YgiQ (UPF0313 family)
MEMIEMNPPKANDGHEKILFGLLPFWTPLIPPLGISCLKSILVRHGYNVKTIDLNTGIKFKEIYNEYFSVLSEIIPAEKSGNLYNIGHDLLHDHMMAHLNHENEEEYIELVNILVRKNYFCQVDTKQVVQLNKVIEEFYIRLEDYFLDVLSRERPTVLGLSVYRGTLAASLFAFKITREKYPEIKTVMGGGIFSQEFEIASSNLKLLLEKKSYIDKIIIGEGEILFLEFLRGKLPVSQRIYTLKDIDGKILDIDSVDIPDFSDFNTRYYLNMASYASRSCPFQCSFCAETIYWGKYRKKKPKQIVNEMKKLYEKYKHPLFLMGDSLLNPIITDLSTELIKSDYTFYWDGYLRVDHHVCNVENALLWRHGGFYRARLGIESGSPHVLRLMGKNITLRQIRDAISTLAKTGIKTTTYWVIGHPGETEEDFQATLALIEELRDDIYEAECNHFRYFETGQVNSAEWKTKYKRYPLFPEDTKDLLMPRTWVLNCEPSREEALKRVNRFVAHCNNLGIPNPYSLSEVHEADERWQKLHKNAVPALIDFSEGNTYIDECKNVKKVLSLHDIKHDEGDFDFL